MTEHEANTPEEVAAFFTAAVPPPAEPEATTEPESDTDVVPPDHPLPQTVAGTGAALFGQGANTQEARARALGLLDTTDSTNQIDRPPLPTETPDARRMREWNEGKR